MGNFMAQRQVVAREDIVITAVRLKAVDVQLSHAPVATSTSCAMTTMDDQTVCYLRENASVLVLLLLMILLAAALYFVNKRWRREQTFLERATGIMNQSHAYALNIARHFLPSFRGEKHQFRGMQAQSSSINVSFEDLSLELPSGACVLKGVSGGFGAGRMCAIMGPSGAGKTTFMNVLCGKATYGKMGGVIRVNGKQAEVSELKSVIGFVPQDDIVHEELTVREQIQFSASLRNKASITQKRVEAITDDVLNVMQIDHIQNSVVGGVEQRGISGGQRKRVNIGLELAAQPSLLFLDEPTSGLDSTSSLAVALSLKTLCRLGTTSIMVIHQPRYSLFTLFDDVLLLGKGGQTVYLGPSLGVKPYFESLGFEMPENENPADWFMDVISGEVPNTQNPDFKPSMLFELWEQRKRDLEPDRLHRQASRAINAHDDRLVLERILEENWDLIDQNGDGFLEESELKDLLTLCSGIVPDETVVGELFKRMAQSESSRVSKEEFVHFISGLQNNVAYDRQASAATDVETSEPASSDIPESRSNDSNEHVELDIECGASPASEAFYARLNRKTPRFVMQLKILAHRRTVQWWRKNRQRGLFVAALAVGAFVLAVLDRLLLKTPSWDSGSLLYVHSAFALLITIFCLQVFGNDQPVFLRESASGVNAWAFYLSRISLNAPDLAFLTFIYSSVYYLVRQPGTPYWIYMMPFALVAYVASAWGYLVSTVVPPKHGPFVSALVIFVVCAVLGDPVHLGDFLDGSVFEAIVSSVSITRWTVAMSANFQIEYTDPHPNEIVEQMQLEATKEVYGRGMWSIGYWWTSTSALVTMGTVLRVLASLGLRRLSARKSA